MKRGRGVAALAAVVSVLALPATAVAGVYWADPGIDAIGHASLDGTGVDPDFIAGGSDPCGVAISSTHVYWANRAAGTIGRAGLEGSGANQSLIAGASAPCGVAVTASHVYWANGGNGVVGTIGRANLDGSAPQQAFISLDGVPCGVAVSSERIYWAQRSGELFSIGRANLDGSDPNEGFIAAGANPCGVAISSTHVYWANRFGGAIGRAAVDGSGVQPQFIPGGSVAACGVAVTAQHVYWAITTTGAIGRANLDGTAPNASFITGASAPCGVAVSGVEPPTTPPPPPPGPAPEPGPPTTSPFPDTDLDGVADPFDGCPSVFEAGTTDGCPVIGVRPLLTNSVEMSPERRRLRVVFGGRRRCPLPTRLRIMRVVGSADVGLDPDPTPANTAFPDRLIAIVSEGLRAYRVSATVAPGTFYAFREAALDPAQGRCPALRSRLREVKAPQLGRRELVDAVRGVGLVRRRGTRRFVRIRGATPIPDGSELDARRGTVTVVVARRDGSTASAEISEGRAIVDQDTARRPTTTLRLSEPLACRRPGQPTAARYRPRRELFVRTTGGRFRTRGSYAAGTASGTAWRTIDTCRTTTIGVVEGTVMVEKLRSGRSVALRTGQRRVFRRARR